MEGRKKILLIARVSTKDQADALPAQTYRLRSYAERKGLDYELIEITESAYKSKRTKFREVVDRIADTKEPVLMAFDVVDRLARNHYSEEVRILDDLRLRGLLELHFVSENTILHKDSSASEVSNFGNNLVGSQYYSHKISDNVKRKFQQMRREGKWTGKAPFGYMNVVLDDGAHWIDEDPVTGKIVRDIFTWYASGIHTLRTIRQKTINEHNLKLTKSHLERILKNPFYVGEMQVQGKEFEHHYKRLITQEQFTRAQDIRLGRGLKSTRYAGLPYAYRGLIECNDCGCVVTYEKKKKKYVYGHCTQTRGKHNASYVREDSITDQLSSSFEKIYIPPEAYEKASRSIRSEKEQEEAERINAIAHLKSDIGNYERRLDKLSDDYYDEEIKKDFYDRKKTEYETSLKNLRKRLETFELSKNDRYATILHLLNVARYAPRYFKKANFEQKRALINLVHSNLLLDGKLLRWKYKKPFEIMAFCNEIGDWQGVRDRYQTLIGVAPDEIVVTRSTKADDKEDENETSV